MPDDERRPFKPEAGAIIFDPAGRMLLGRYREEPDVWSAPRQAIRFGGEPEHDAIMAALNHARAKVEVIGEPWWSDWRVPEQGIHRMVWWYECLFLGSTINLPSEHVLESAWVHPRSVALHPLMIPNPGQFLPSMFVPVAEHLRSQYA